MMAVSTAFLATHCVLTFPQRPDSLAMPECLSDPVHCATHPQKRPCVLPARHNDRVEHRASLSLKMVVGPDTYVTCLHALGVHSPSPRPDDPT